MSIRKLCLILGQKKPNCYKMMETVMSGAGKEFKIFSGEDLNKVSSSYGEFITGLANPKITVGLKSTKKGSGVASVFIQDGNKPVYWQAYGIDKTRGGVPIIQGRVCTFSDGKKIESATCFINPNRTINSENYALNYSSKNLSKNCSLYDEEGNLLFSNSYTGTKAGPLSAQSKEFKPLTADEYNEMATEHKAFYKTKGVGFLSPAECKKEIIEIATRKGETTVESITKAKNMLLKKMGYDQELLKLEVFETDTIPGLMGYEIQTGTLLMSKDMLKATNQEVALILSHELTHFHDWVRYYKAVGHSNFTKNINGEINKDFYEKMAEYVNGRSIDTKAMTDYLKSMDEVSKLKGKYQQLKYKIYYALSPLEHSARETEKEVLEMFKKKGIKFEPKATPIETFAQESSSMAAHPLKQLELAHGNTTETFYNNHYDEALKKVNPQLYDIEQKLKTASNDEEVKNLLEEGDKIASKYKGDKLDFEILQKMLAISAGL